MTFDLEYLYRGSSCTWGFIDDFRLFKNNIFEGYKNGRNQIKFEDSIYDTDAIIS